MESLLPVRENHICWAKEERYEFSRYWLKEGLLELHILQVGKQICYHKFEFAVLSIMCNTMRPRFEKVIPVESQSMPANFQYYLYLSGFETM